MADIPEGRREFDRMIARHKAAIERTRLEFERTRRELDDRIAALREAMSAAKEEFLQAIERGDAPLDAARKYRDIWGNWPDSIKHSRRPPRSRWPRRGLEGGEPVPVEPRPKPKPLIDGAEAPIE